jgi:excisionase family DNA binding protein
MQDQNWLSSIRPLPSRVIPLPEEDLASLLCRSAHVMGYKSVLWLLRPEEVSHSIERAICRLNSAMSYRVLERLLLLSEETLYGMTFHRFASQLQAPGETPLLGENKTIKRPVLTSSIPRRFIASQTDTRVCPLCLEEGESYGRLHWGVLPVVTCPRHHILLVDQCPVCQKAIPVLRSSLTCCPQCQRGDYRQAPIIPLVDVPLLHISQALILGHLGIEEYKTLGMTGESLSPLTHLMPWQYFRLFDAFRYVLSPLSPAHPFLQASSHLRTMLNSQLNGNPERSFNELLVFIVTFHYIFESWPNNFFAFLKSFPLTREHISAGGVTGHFGAIYQKWLYGRLTHASFTFLRDAFTDYLKKHYTGGAVSRLHRPFQEGEAEIWQDCRYLTMAQTTKMLGITNKMNTDGSVSRGHKLIFDDVLRAIKVTLGEKGKTHVFLVEKADVETLLKQWSELIPCKTVQQSFLGVSRGCMRSLRQAGLLIPCMPKGRTWLYKPAEVEHFISVVMQHAQKKSCDTLDAVLLTRFRPFANWTLKDTLLAIFNGSLKLTDMETQQPLFQRLVLTHAEADHFLEDMVRQRCQDSGLLTVSEVASRLGVGVQSIRRWINEGFVETETLVIGKARSLVRISQEAVKAFRRTYVLAEEAAELLSVTLKRLSNYVRGGRLHSLGSKGQKYLFLREEVEALKLTLASDGIRRRRTSRK